MITVYRIVKTEKRTQDLSGTGAFKYGGRWNNIGTYLLYTAETSSLAFLETLVHVDEVSLPADLFITTIIIKDEKLLYNVPDEGYPAKWKNLDNLENKLAGDKWMAGMKYLGYIVKSAVNPMEYNYLLNPLFPNFAGLVEVSVVSALTIDSRLIK